MKTDRHPWLATYDALGLDWHQLPPLPDKTLSDYVRDYAQQFADREALVFMGQAISYRQLDQLADRMAVLFQQLGCEPGDVVGLQMPNTPQYVVAFVAAARLGLVCTSISPLMTPPEIIHQANDANVKVLLTLEPFWQAAVQKVLGEVPGLSAVLVSGPMDLLAAGGAAFDETRQGVRILSLHDSLPETASVPPTVPVSLDAVLYLQYTGGTTGLPKGARLSSRNLFINNLQANEFYGYRNGEETVISAFPLFHIGGAAVLFNALRTASTFLLIPDPRDVGHMVAEMQARTPTVIAAVPALFQMLCADEGFKALDFSTLRNAISGAAPFAEEEVRQLEAIIGPGKFCEVYGMTETSPVITLNPASRFKPGHVGVPLPGTEVKIVDIDTGKPLPLGEPGEIVAAGPQVMVGYLSQSQNSDHALREQAGRRWMHTGDIGVMDEQGYVRVCDRSKDMLIVGGYKVFSVEVENRIQALPWVALCAVVGRPDQDRPGNDVVQLYLQATDTDVLSEQDKRCRQEEVLEYCRETLSPYKVPREVVFVDAIPLTSVGKIDKKALRSAV